MTAPMSASMTASMTAPTTASTTAPLLACRGLDLRFGRRWLVRSLELEVGAGQRWALVGPNGSGKTSLLLVLAGVRRPDAGSVELGGRPMADWGVEEMAGMRALVADRWFDPFATSVLGSVMAARYRLRGGLRAAHSADPDALGVARRCLEETDCLALAGRDIRFLSRGERQRVALAAALAQETPLLLLDEPISHQDPRHQIQVLERLRAGAPAASIAALHDINAAARIATHALLLSGEGSWQAGPSREVLNREALSRLFGTNIAEVEVESHRVFVSTSDARE